MSIISLQNGLNATGGSEDTYIKSDSLSSNYGSSTSLFVNNSSFDSSAFIKWDLSNIPSNITIISAKIELFVETGEAQNTNYLYKVNRKIDFSKATWNNYNTGLLWETGGCQSSPEDRGDVVLGQIDENATSNNKLEIELNDEGLSVLTNWITGADINNGFVIQNFVDNSISFISFSSSEAAIINNRPKLTITYSLSNEFNNIFDSPTLLYPDGNEFFVGEDINIQWNEPLNIPSTVLIWYEIFITDSFNDYSKPDLLQIATIPSGNSSYIYTAHKNLKGDKCRIGIRTVNHEGLRSKISFSSTNFSITNKELPSPSLVSPEPNVTYFSYIPVVFDHSSIIGRSSQRSFYQIYYKSETQSIDWKLLRDNILVGADPFNIDVSSFSTSSDYSLKIELVDEDTVSPPVFINDITINNINYFLIDTIPPVGHIKIQNNQEYTKDKSLVISIKGYDETTGVKEFRIEQIDAVSNENLQTGEYSALSPLATWDIKGDDGVKLIQLRLKDYGDNIISSDINANYFRTYKNLDNREVTSFLYDKNDLYMAFNGDDDNDPQLYKNLSLIATLDGEATALKFYNDTLYISIKDDENKGILQRLSGGSVEVVMDNSSQYSNSINTIVNSLYSSDSVINSMEVFDDTLFMGLENGELVSFSGYSVDVVYDTYSNIRSISNIKTDENILYIYFENTTEIVIMNKTVSGVYNFTIVETVN